jgi:hypothetical protein
LIKKAIIKQEKILIIVLALVVISLAMAVLWVTYLHQILLKQFSAPGAIQPSPTPVSELTATPSAYATDSAILRIKSSLQEIEKELGATDLYEAGLLPPVLYIKVEFEE